MDIATVAGLIGAALVVVATLVIEGGNPAELFGHPQAILITMGGSIVATMMQNQLSVTLDLPKFLVIAFTEHVKLDFIGMVELISRMADKARREGLLALEEESKTITDEFLGKGIMMVVDGVDPHQIHAILETSVAQMKERHKRGYNFFATCGGFGPTFGIIGTVMGLISVLKKLDNPEEMAKGIAAAFFATLWGLLSANLIFIPVGGKLKSKSEEEQAYRHMLLEGIAAIQAGENPRVIRDKLLAYVPPAVAAKASGGEGAKKGAEA